MTTADRTTAADGGKSVYTTRPTTTIVGVLFIVATVSAVLGLMFYQPILNGSDYLTRGAESASQVQLGVLMEVILVLSAIGTAVGLFPYLRKHNESLALGYLCFRFLEAAVITVGIVTVLSLLKLSQAFVSAAAPNASAFEAAGTLLLAAHAWTFLLGPYVFLGVNTALYSYLLYRTGLVPRPLAILGLIGAALVFVAGVVGLLLGVFAQLTSWGVAMAMPIAAYEMILAGWLIVKGLNSSAIAAEPVKSVTPAANELPIAA